MLETKDEKTMINYMQFRIQMYLLWTVRKHNGTVLTED